ncbi:hypothetical protein C7B18_23645 [Escherichia coli]|nr:hypothetical protein C7B18_23645 [Escherichia coli]
MNHSPYSWHWNVRFRPQEAVYIGNDTCHITITCNQSGFHLTRDRQRCSLSVISETLMSCYRF